MGTLEEKCEIMKYIPKPRWTHSQKEFVKNNYEKYTDEQLSVLIGRTLKSIRRMRERLGKKKASGRGICKAYVPKT